MRNKKIIQIIIIVLIVCTVIGVNKYDAYADDLIKIYTAEDLRSINDNMSGDYILMNDIDLSDATAEGGLMDFMGNGWNPIGSENCYYGDRYFSGTFNGNGHSIKGMRIDVNNVPQNIGNTVYVGLFAYNRGTISNLKIDDAKIIVNVNDVHINMGTLVGRNGGEIYNVHIDVDFRTTSTMDNATGANQVNTKISKVGGIVGFNDDSGSIHDCDISGSMIASGRSYISESYIIGKVYGYGANFEQIVGGICGSNNGILNKCWSNTSISSKGDTLYVSSNGVVPSDNSSYYMHSYIGGITGLTEKGVENCYSSSSIKYDNVSKYPQLTESYIGGISGRSQYYSVFSHCYNIGNVNDGKGYPITGYTIGDLPDCYYLEGKSVSDDRATSLTSKQMRNCECYSNFDFDKIWVIDEVSDYNYPQLVNNRQDTKDIIKVEISQEPDQIEYYTNDRIKLDGGLLKVYYKDDTTKDIAITEKMISGYDMAQTGIQEVKVTYLGYENTFHIIISSRPDIKEMYVLSEPNKKEFAINSRFDFDGCKVKVIYVNNSEQIIDITEDMTNGGDINQLGCQTIAYSLLDKTVEFVIEVVPVKMIGIKVFSTPNKTSFVEGTSVNFEGMVVHAVYNNDDEKEITDYIVGDIPKEVGTHSVILTYDVFETTVDIEIIEKSVVELSVKNNPSKVKYVIGQTFDPTGMIIEASYDNGEVSEVTGYSIGALPSEAGYGKVTISYGKKETYVNVLMNNRVIENISITQLPEKTNYIEEESFDSTGLIVSAHFNDDTDEEISNYELSNIDTKTIGDNNVLVSYKDKSTSFIIHIEKKTLNELNITEPTKKSYIEGEAFDSSGLVVQAIYNNGKSENVNDYTISGFGATEEENVISVSFSGITKTFTIIIHKAEDNWTTVNEATCNGTGKRELRCSRCQEVLKSEDILALGHTEETLPAVAPTCTTPGKTAGKKCSVCEEILEAQADVPALGHDWGDWKVKREATETEEGLEERICKIDPSHTESRTIPKKEASEKDKDEDKGGNKDKQEQSSTTPDTSQKPSDNKDNTPSNPTTTTSADKQDDQKPSNPSNPDEGKEKSAGDGVGTISSDGTILTDIDGVKYYVSAKVKAGDLKNNLKVADKKSGGKYKITKVTKKKGKVTGGTVTYMAPYNKNCTKATAGNYIKIGGVKFKITAVNANAFKRCTKLKSFTAGENITTIGKNAFKDCKNLKTFTIKSLSLKSIGANSFKGVNAKIRFKVPKKKLDRYERMIRKAGAPKTSKITK